MIMRLKKRAFVEKLDFVTSPGHLHGGDSRRELGMPGRGPTRVITDKAVFSFEPPDFEMALVELGPGESVATVQAEVGWPLRLSAELRPMIPPSDEELALIRQELDPQGLYR
jgi:glutaconate CoA-transferase subunit B